MLASCVSLCMLRSGFDRAQMAALSAYVLVVLTCPIFALRRVLLLQIEAIDCLLLPLQRWQQGLTQAGKKAAAVDASRLASGDLPLSQIRHKYQQTAGPQLCNSVQVKILQGKRQVSDQISRCGSSTPPQTSYFTDPEFASSNATTSASSYDSIWTESTQGQCIAKSLQTW
ncbi:hypothetical protein WJX73_004844 [Symbiochloris irregularis]|uniref:Uncharacterized protein n=1 Tax=Symbiochloris irregularis TaxID=706552 RepID=A0AAW1NZA5_9CHLO